MCPGPQHQKMFRTLNLKHHVSQPLLLIYEQETVWVNSWDWFMENTKPKLVLSIYYISIIYVQSEGFCFCFAFCWRASYILSLFSAKFLRLFLIYGGSFFIGQIKARFAEVESLGSASKYKKRTKNQCLRHLQFMCVPLEQKSMMHVQSCKVLVIKPIASLMSPLPSALCLL